MLVSFESSGVDLVWRGNVHSFVFYPLVHVVSYCCWSKHDNLWNHILLCSQHHRIFTDMRDDCTRSGTIWSIFAVTGSCGMSRRQVCVEVIVWPSGRTGCTLNLMLVVYSLLVHFEGESVCFAQVKDPMVCWVLEFIIYYSFTQSFVQLE